MLPCGPDPIFPSRPRSDLDGTAGKLVGFGFDDHPLKKGWKIHLVFYWIKPDRWVLCLSETPTPNPSQMTPHLGELVPGEEFSPFAQRRVEGLTTLAEFKEMMVETWPHIHFYWWEEK